MQWRSLVVVCAALLGVLGWAQPPTGGGPGPGRGAGGGGAANLAHALWLYLNGAPPVAAVPPSTAAAVPTAPALPTAAAAAATPATPAAPPTLPPNLDLRYCRVCKQVAYKGKSECLNKGCVPWIALCVISFFAHSELNLCFFSTSDHRPGPLESLASPETAQIQQRP